jgi:acetoacetate decarboxylase
MSMLQVVTMRGVDADLGQPWVGDAQLELFDSPWDEPASLLPVREVLGGYYREVGVTFAGGELLTDMSQPI